MAPMMYKAFGLKIRSEFALNVLDAIETDPNDFDVEVVAGHGIIRDPNPYLDPYFEIDTDEQYMHWRAIGAYLIKDDRRIVVETHKDISDHLVSQALLGIVMAIMLERRHLLCLHASAINTNGRAAIFLGDKGAGKSTTSGAMLAAGGSPISDDLVALEGVLNGDSPAAIRPGFSFMKIWPDTAKALSLEMEETDCLIHPHTTKIQKRMPKQIRDENVPLGAAFILERAAEATETKALRLPPHEALQMVLRNTFMARFGETKLGRQHLMLHMQRCSAIVAQTPFYALRIVDDITKLDRLTEEIIRVTADA